MLTVIPTFSNFMLTNSIDDVRLQYENAPHIRLFAPDAFGRRSILVRGRRDRAGANRIVTTLYRTPNIIIDKHEWHVAVVKHYGRTSVRFFWRPLSPRAERWQPIVEWQGPKPKRMGNAFWRFRSHIREAMEYERARAKALAGVERTALGTPVRPAGRKDPHHHGLGLASAV